MNRDVFLSLLALDSYNRGYGQNVLTRPGDLFTGTNELGRQLGTATISAQQIDKTAQAAGFYAIAYDWNGGRVISYRGTNFETDFRPSVTFSTAGRRALAFLRPAGSK